MTREEAIASGSKFYCVACHKTFKTVLYENYEDGHGGRPLTMCPCGCDLIVSLTTDRLVDAQGNELPGDPGVAMRCKSKAHGGCTH